MHGWKRPPRFVDDADDGQKADLLSTVLESQISQNVQIFCQRSERAWRDVLAIAKERFQGLAILSLSTFLRILRHMLTFQKVLRRSAVLPVFYHVDERGWFPSNRGK